MIESILPDLYRIEIPLPESPLKSLNSYIIKSPNRNLIVDTGFNREECLVAMQTGLKQLDINLDETDIFITHLHADHFGLVTELSSDKNQVLFNQPDAEFIKAWDGFEDLLQYADKSGFPRNELQTALDAHPASRYDPGWIPELHILEDGAAIEVGAYRFTCVMTPGHTRGHMCLYEPDKKVMLTGDHILYDITPHIQCWTDELNPLKSYLESLAKVRDLDVELALPGHRSAFTNFKERIDELLQHHKARAEEALAVLGNGSKTAFQIAPDMTWDIKFDSWEEFPVLQKWFATGETIAHLRYLEEQGIVTRKTQENLFVYSRNNS
jgi:glyoxylase-like metal-dependent hydrolase (beta-lactamase superfamily II)